MRHESGLPAAAVQRRRVGTVLAVVGLALLVAAVINVWLAWSTAEWWPLVVSVPELLGAAVSSSCAYRHLRHR
jgi:hypothetical protein